MPAAELIPICGFSKMGVPLTHPFYQDFSLQTKNFGAPFMEIYGKPPSTAAKIHVSVASEGWITSFPWEKNVGKDIETCVKHLQAPNAGPD